MWFQYLWHLERNGGKSQDSDTGSNPGALCFENYYTFRNIQNIDAEKQ
jgi:hypothetical protein